jgi:hypothetical protein
MAMLSGHDGFVSLCSLVARDTYAVASPPINMKTAVRIVRRAPITFISMLNTGTRCIPLSDGRRWRPY